MVIDQGHQGSSSLIAAGIINPITGHRLNITEGFHEYFPIARSLYRTIEQELKISVFQSVLQYRLIKNPGQHDYFQQRLTEPEYHDLMSEVENDVYSDCEHGVAAIESTAIVDTRELLESMRRFLEQQASFREEHIVYEDLSFSEQIRLEDISAANIIFCEGYQAINNPWLAELPFKLAKGEILTVETDQQEPRMLNWGNWLAPNSHGQSRLGSNFVWNDLTLETTPEVATDLLRSLSDNTVHSTRTIRHDVGIRPTTKQRKPFIGPISDLTNAYCFNGFGSKGCLIIPHYAGLLTSHLLQGTELPVEVTQWL